MCQQKILDHVTKAMVVMSHLSARIQPLAWRRVMIVVLAVVAVAVCHKFKIKQAAIKRPIKNGGTSVSL